MGKPRKKTSKKARSSKAPASLASPKKRAGVAERTVIFAPWRIEFITGPREKGCFFCKAARPPATDQAAWKRVLLLVRNEHAMALMNRYPYTGGHLLIAPRRHTSDLANLSEAESRSLWELTRECIEILQQVMAPQGFNTGMNLGKAAGAGVEDHLHMHAVPRWVGDANFLPVIGGTGTIPVALGDLWDELRPVFRRRESR